MMASKAKRLAGLILFVFAVVALAEPANARMYQTSIELSSGDPNAGTNLSWGFQAVGDDYEKVDGVEIDFPQGMKVVPGAFQKKCMLVDFDSDGGEVCAKKYPDAKIGSGKITTSAFGRHAVAGEAYLVDETKTPGQANVVFFFPSGQVFGAGAQTLLSWMHFDGDEASGFVMKNIQGQLSLPFGMSAKLIDGDFRIVGQGGERPYSTPSAGSVSTWKFTAKMSWGDEVEPQTLQATVR